MRKELFLIIFVFLQIVSGQKKNIEISGFVVEKEKGIPLVGANVLIKEANLGNVTNEAGAFKISKINCEKKITLIVSHVGFAKFEKEITLENEKDTLNNILIELFSKEVVMEEVEIKAKNPNTNRSDSFSSKSGGIMVTSRSRNNDGSISKEVRAVNMDEQKTGKSAGNLIYSKSMFIIAGVVLYAIDNKPLSAATIKLKGKDISVTTNQYGAFSFLTEIDKGPYILEIHLNNYIVKEEKLDLSKNFESFKELIIKLEK